MKEPITRNKTIKEEPGIEPGSVCIYREKSSSSVPGEDIPVPDHSLLVTAVAQFIAVYQHQCKGLDVAAEKPVYAASGHGAGSDIVFYGNSAGDGGFYDSVSSCEGIKCHAESAVLQYVQFRDPSFPAAVVCRTVVNR